MFPLGYVIAFAVRVVLEADDGHEVTVCEFRVQGFDFFVQGHVALRARKPVRNAPLIAGDVPITLAYSST